MLTPFDTLRGCTLAAQDGEIGEVREFYFDDTDWTMRYLVVATGSWMNERYVLISPSALQEIDAQSRAITTELTRQQVCDSPPLDSDQPVSRQHEAELHRHYGWDPYWVVPAAAATGPYAPAVYMQSEALADPPPPQPAETEGDPHLRSSAEVANQYAIHTHDGDIGRVYDFILDDERWQVRYVVVRTGIWFGKDVLLAPEWIDQISFERREILVNLPRSAIKDAPEYDSSAPVSSRYEQHLHDHYGRRRQGVEASRGE